MTVQFTIDSPPVPKARPRLTRKGHAYTPKATRQYEAVVAEAARAAMDGLEPLTGPVQAVLHFNMPIPKSWSKKAKKEALGEYHVKRPDLDNLVKAVIDGCEGVVYDNDSKIVRITALKSYSDEPCTWVRFTNADYKPF